MNSLKGLHTFCVVIYLFIYLWAMSLVSNDHPTLHDLNLNP
jgi:hypothetical protein